MQIKKIIILIACLFNVCYLFAQKQIIGNVIDKETKQLLPGANIFVKSNWNIGTTTNSKGLFVLEIPSDFANDSIVISYVGYKDLCVAITNSKNLTIELDPFAQLIDESVVTARRIIAEEFTVKQIKQMDIYLNPAAKADALLAVNAMPASTTTDESANVSLRGSRPDETGIFLNDVPIYDAIRFAQLNGIGTFSIFNTDVIDRMHVFAGNPPLEYGNASSGLVSLQTKNRIPEKPINSFAISLANIGGFTSRKLAEKTSIIAFANYQPSKIFTGVNKDASRNLKKFNSSDLGLHLIHNFNNNVRFKFFNYSNLEGYDFLNETPSFAGIFDMDKKRNYSIANFIMQKSNSEITINGAYSISAETFEYSTSNVSVNKQDVFFSSTYQHFFDKLSTKIGISIDYRENDSYGTKPVFYYAQDKNHPTMSFDSFESYLLPELFAYAKYKLTPNFIAGAGLRKNIKVNNEPDFLSYQGNLNYKLNKKHNINLSAGHYNKLAMPNAEQYEITHYKNNQIGLDYSFTGNWIKVQAAIFNKETNYQNSSSSVKGAEIYGKMNLNNLTLQMSFTSVDAKITTSNTTYPSKYNLNYFVRSSLKYNLNDIVEISAIYLFRQGCHYLPVISSKYIAKFDEHQPIYDVIDNLRRLPDYHKIDLSISRYWVVNTGLALVLYANVSNLLNTDNVQSVNYNYNYSKKFNELYSKRSFYFGINIMF